MKIKAVVARGQGGPEVLALDEVELEWPRRSGDVLVRLAAAGLNPADVFFRQLGPYLQSGLPLVLGHDGAGVVSAVGAAVSTVKPGDRVCFCNGGIGGDMGTYADHAVVPEDQLVRLPADIDFVRAAALPLVAITAWEALYDRAALAAGEYALVHAGAGGTGHVAVQLAKLRGARVAATVSSPEKAKFVAGLGADAAIDYRKQDFVDACRQWSAGRGVDVALDNVGGETMLKTYRAMAPYGRVVTLMGTPGDDAETTAYNANLTIHNVMMLTPMWKGLRDRLTRQAEIVRQAVGLLSSGKISVHVAATFPLAEAARAQAMLEAGGMMGKVVLTMD